MNKSESIKEIAPAFLAAQQNMHAAPKEAENPHFRSRYADFAAVVSAVKGPLNEQGIAFMQMPRLTETGVEVETVLMHRSGEFYADTLTIPLMKRDAQSVGSATSYGKRYGLQSMCGLPTDDDDDGNEAAKGAERKPVQKQADALADNTKFKAAVGAAFKQRGFNATQQASALAAWREKHGLKTATDAELEARHALIDHIGRGSFDAFKAPKQEASV